MTRKENKAMQMVLAYLMVLPSFLLILGIIAYPIVNSVIRSFQVKGQPGVYSVENYIYFFTDKLALANLFYTLGIVIVTVALSIVIAYGISLYLRFVNSFVSKTVGALYLIPRFIPGLVAVNAVITIIRDGGLINRIAASAGFSFNLGWMFDAKGIVLMNLWFNIPFATMLLMSSLSGIQDSLIESARDAGSSKWNILKTIILPLTAKDIMIAVTFIFMGNIGSFTTPYLMGGNFPQMLGISLFQQFNKTQYERAAALSVIMFLLCLTSAVVYIYTNMKGRSWEQPE